MAMLAVLILPLSILGFTGARHASPRRDWPASANAARTASARSSMPITSGTGNNGSRLRRPQRQHAVLQHDLGFAMLIGRFLMIVPMLAIAGSLAAKKIVPPSAGTFPTHGPLFVGLLIGVILIVGGLTFFPALALGPIVEHLAMTPASSSEFEDMTDGTHRRRASGLPSRP